MSACRAKWRLAVDERLAEYVAATLVLTGAIFQQDKRHVGEVQFRFHSKPELLAAQAVLKAKLTAAVGDASQQTED